MDNFYFKIGERMKFARKTLRFTQEKTAAAAGIDASFYGQIERGVNVPSLKTFVAIAKALQVSPEVLLGQSDHNSDRLKAEVLTRILARRSASEISFMMGMLNDMRALAVGE